RSPPAASAPVLFPSYFTPRAVRPHLHSFPTRRSSDLNLFRIVKNCQSLCKGFGFGNLAHVFAKKLRTSACQVKVGGFKHGNFFRDRKSTRLNSSHRTISYAVFCLKKKNARLRPMRA